MKKTFAIYYLAFGQPYEFYNEDKNCFIWADPKKATLYTKEEALRKSQELIEPFIDEYQKSGKNYKEIRIGDLFLKNILKEETI